MGRKVIFFVCALALVFALCVTAQAATHTIYDGNMSSTYVTYFRDIVSGIGFTDNYIAFRSGQYEYTMVVGKLEYDGVTFSLTGSGKEYTIVYNSQYSSTYQYRCTDISNFSVDVGNRILYSDVGNYPQLVERGAKYEMFTAVLVCTALLCIVINRIFYYR